MQVLTIAQIRGLDEHACAIAGVPDRLLMEVAGNAAAALLLSALRRLRTRRQVVVVTGKGNNAGDGFVLARACAAGGVPVRVLALEAPDALPPGPARENGRLLEAYGVAVTPVRPGDLAAELRQGSVVVDALLGTGVAGRVRPPYGAAIEAINASGLPVFALDLPSGLHGDTGAVLGSAVAASWTVTFGAWKAGMLTGEGPRLCGACRLVRLPYPPSAWLALGLPVPDHLVP